MTVEEAALDGTVFGEEPARAGLRAAGDEDLGLGDGLIADFERLGHVACYGA